MQTVMDRLYLELATVVSPDTKSARELALQAQIDKYGITLMMIAEGCADPVGVAQLALSHNNEVLKARYEQHRASQS